MTERCECCGEGKDAMTETETETAWQCNDCEQWNEGARPMKTATLDGKRIAYTDDTEFLVQVGRGRGKYETKYQFKGELARAVMHYKCINIGRGYKKRLVMPNALRPVLARALS